MSNCQLKLMRKVTKEAGGRCSAFPSLQDTARAAECCHVGFRVRNLRKKVALGLCSLELTLVPVSVETGGPNEMRFERMKKSGAALS